MKAKTVNAVSSLFTLLLLMATAACADTAKQSLLADGFVLTGVDGRLINSSDGNRWLFRLDSETSDDKSTLPAGTTIELLDCATLEKMTDDVKNRSEPDYRLWGRVTRYKGRNFLFPGYFLPLSRAEQPTQQTQPKGPDSAVAINEPNDPLAIPQQIIEQLTNERPAATVGQSGTGPQTKNDFLLVDRSGVLMTTQQGRLVFRPDGLGRKIEKISMEILPSQVLEQMQSRQSAESEPVRFKVSGIVTRFKDKNYFLLQRALPSYSYGNFDR